MDFMNFKNNPKYFESPMNVLWIPFVIMLSLIVIFTFNWLESYELLEIVFPNSSHLNNYHSLCGMLASPFFEKTLK